MTPARRELISGMELSRVMEVMGRQRQTSAQKEVAWCSDPARDLQLLNILHDYAWKVSKSQLGLCNRQRSARAALHDCFRGPSSVFTTKVFRQRALRPEVLISWKGQTRRRHCTIRRTEPRFASGDESWCSFWMFVFL